MLKDLLSARKASVGKMREVDREWEGAGFC